MNCNKIDLDELSLMAFKDPSTAFINGKDVKARMDLLSAASMGSTAFQKGLGAIHSLSHPINGKFNVHHGLSNAIFMPYVLTFNKPSIQNKICLLYTSPSPRDRSLSRMPSSA